MKHKRLAIIPARGGSKRIPRKNIKDFLGKPIIAYSIQTAIKSNLFDEVMVSTDDPEMAEISKKYGAKVPFIRSKKNAGDHATTTDVILEVLEQYKQVSMYFEYSCCIYPAAPLIDIKNLTLAWQKLIQADLITVFPVVAYTHPIWRGLRINKGFLQMIWPQNISKRTQDFETVFHDAAQFYWFNCDKFKEYPFFMGSKNGSIILPAEEVQDIDNISDWRIAELKYKLKYG